MEVNCAVCSAAYFVRGLGGEVCVGGGGVCKVSSKYC